MFTLNVDKPGLTVGHLIAHLMIIIKKKNLQNECTVGDKDKDGCLSLHVFITNTLNVMRSIRIPTKPTYS